MRQTLTTLFAEAQAADIALHSVQISVAGESLVSDSIEPFGLDVPHRMYSVSKSFTGLAVLLLAEEGRLDLDDGIAAYFPEQGPVHPWLEQTRIDDMLAMTGPHSRTTYVEASDSWFDSYFRVPPTHRAGTLFTYDTSASYVLAALVERIAGMPVLDYLRPRLLDPLGVGAGAHFLPGPEGISHGGSGLIMAPGDLLPIAELLNAGGCLGAERIVPERAVARLLERRSSPAMQTWGAPLRAGYGRQVWLPGGGGWMMFGLGGQIVYGDPARRIAAVVTADTTTLTGGDQRLVDMLLRALDVVGADGRDADAVSTPALAPPAPGGHPGNARSLVVEVELMTGEDAPEAMSVDVGAAGGRVRWDAAHELVFDTERPMTTRTPLGDAVITAGWTERGVLDVRLSAVGNDIASVRLRLVADDDGILTVMCQGFGPAIDPSWTFRGSYRH
ncbi:beta-lactamase family protein [Microbacterium sp. M28]|uniref:serine hydrolase domain-containing protein n=1 Tax=Microbacterium sp. M28 TaxID=2962064 RepID=UPI0021F48B5B|nr:serine hydrolase domain-containing protein [Microbacterium sp. M28]UYO97552.1 beta-lactamase family protein [Microbacterium sp. M28]